MKYKHFIIFRSLEQSFNYVSHNLERTFLLKLFGLKKGREPLI